MIIYGSNPEQIAKQNGSLVVYVYDRAMALMKICAGTEMWTDFYVLPRER